jgi:hypothetical protein
MDAKGAAKEQPVEARKMRAMYDVCLYHEIVGLLGETVIRLEEQEGGMSAVEAREQKPIFLQTGFRTGGTWLWGRFRANPMTIAFIEPLNELLASMSAEEIARLTPENLRLNHPILKMPYFEEYRNFLKADGTGVRGYEVRMGLESYFRDDDAGNEGLDNYLSQYIAASMHDKTPVLKFTRALGRAGWLRRHFPTGIQILLLRNPLLQFWSAHLQAVERGNYTFLMMPTFALSRALQAAKFHSMIAETGIPYIPMSDDPGSCFAKYTKIAEGQSFAESLTRSLIFSMISYEMAIVHADIVIDLDDLPQADYRASMQDQLSTATGLRLDLSDVMPTDGASLADDPRREALLASTEDLLASLPSSLHRSINYVGLALGRITGRLP